MNILKGDFIGFTLGDCHSSELGIIRTSDGSRFNENLLPTSNDKTITVEGRDETFYLSTNYTQRAFSIQIAFDSMTEKQKRKLQQIIMDKSIKKLIFDETPYKYYLVKSSGDNSLKYLCFSDDDEYTNIYKGEGTLNFIAYYPFAKSRFLFEEDYTVNNIPEWFGGYENIWEWAESAGIHKRNFKLDNQQFSYNSILKSTFFGVDGYGFFFDNQGDLLDRPIIKVLLQPNENSKISFILKMVKNCSTIQTVDDPKKVKVYNISSNLDTQLDITNYFYYVVIDTNLKISYLIKRKKEEEDTFDNFDFSNPNKRAETSEVILLNTQIDSANSDYADFTNSLENFSIEPTGELYLCCSQDNKILVENNYIYY